ncbi:SMI1/KNR4 family protein [Kitasatospora sp. NBC_01560]|uniref:SMI1/KNR4 family protein n=1 Tax=Kitasatospora sp. NBC_01560 TaxID=2975965 RepID=UPI0038664879
MTTIDELRRLVPPPADPVDTTGDWQQVEAALGLGLPADFKALDASYGRGLFVDFISPLTSFGARNLLLEHARRLLDGERSFRRTNPEKCPHLFYPEPGGLLEWAAVDNGARLCWRTEGEPDTWTVVAWTPRSWYYESHEMGAVEFLHGLLSGRITTEAFSLEVEVEDEYDGDDGDDGDDSEGEGEAGGALLPVPVFEPARR